MIKTEKGQTQLEGTGGELLTDLSVISESLYKALKEYGEGEGAKK